MEGKIFISYRRSDTAGFAQLLYGTLEKYFPPEQVFMDVDEITPGADFVERLQEEVLSCDILLALMGPTWLSTKKSGSKTRRLDDPNDWVRIEIATALERGILVIPVLFQGAAMPGAHELPDDLQMLSRRQAVVIGDPAVNDIENKLIRHLQREMERIRLESSPTQVVVETLSLDDIEAPDPFAVKRGGFSYADVTKPHAYVAMPIGRKQAGNNQWIDFNAVYYEFIRPALDLAGFEVFRIDDDNFSGDLLTDMFQELLLADLVVCDLSLDDANVFYALGIRHSLRQRGIVHISCSQTSTPYHTFNVRTLGYQVDSSGRPDPEMVDNDVNALARFSRDVWASDQDAIHSPMFNLLTGLNEPERRNLRTPLATGYWREYNEWNQRVTIAQRQKRVGDILILTEEVSNPDIKLEAIQQSYQALQNMGRYELALYTLRKGLELNSNNLEMRRNEAFLLNRLGLVDEAIEKMEAVIKDHPHDEESISYLARIYKEVWQESWINVDDEMARINEAFRSSHWLSKAIDIYATGFKKNLDNFYAGYNAAVWMSVFIYLANSNDDPDHPDAVRYKELLPAYLGGVQLAIQSAMEANESDYWSMISLAELTLISADDIKEVTRKYSKALALSRKNTFYIQAGMTTLKWLESIGYRAEYVNAAKEVLAGEIKSITGNEEEDGTEEWVNSVYPDQNAYLYAGHALSLADEQVKVFPPQMESLIAEELGRMLAQYETTNNDVAYLTGAAAGGDILFAEACLKRGMLVQIFLPYEEARYVRNKISPAGDVWVERYYHIKNHPLVEIQLQSELIGLPKGDIDIYYRNYRWAMYSSLQYGIENCLAIFFWDGHSTTMEGELMQVLLQDVREMGLRAQLINPQRLQPPRITIQTAESTSARTKSTSAKRKTAPKTKTAAKKTNGKTGSIRKKAATKTKTASKAKG